MVNAPENARVSSSVKDWPGHEHGPADRGSLRGRGDTFLSSRSSLILQRKACGCHASGACWLCWYWPPACRVMQLPTGLGVCTWLSAKSAPGRGWDCCVFRDTRKSGREISRALSESHLSQRCRGRPCRQSAAALKLWEGDMPGFVAALVESGALIIQLGRRKGKGTPLNVK